MCRDGFRAICQRCGEVVTCRDDSPVHEWQDCEPEAQVGARMYLETLERMSPSPEVQAVINKLRAELDAEAATGSLT